MRVHNFQKSTSKEFISYIKQTVKNVKRMSHYVDTYFITLTLTSKRTNAQCFIIYCYYSAMEIDLFRNLLRKRPIINSFLKHFINRNLWLRVSLEFTAHTYFNTQVVQRSHKMKPQILFKVQLRYQDVAVSCILKRDLSVTAQNWFRHHPETQVGIQPFATAPAPSLHET